MSAAADPVLDLIARRRAGGAVRKDRARLGLVIEGGGMRGVVGGGMVAALEVLGLRTAFDHVVGASAGACAGAYFLAGQAALGTRIFYEDINNRTFIDLARALRGRPVMNLDFLIDEVMAHAKRLDWPAIRDGGVGFSAVATDADSATAVTLDSFRGRAELMDGLRASSRIPLLAGPPVALCGHRLVDGGVVQPVPLDVAVAAGCDHLLVLRTRPSGHRPKPPGAAMRLLLGPLIARRLSPALARATLARARMYVALDERLEADPEPIMRSIQLAEGTPPIKRLETRAGLLHAAALAGANAVFDGLETAGIAVSSAEREALETNLRPATRA
jgi:predicted patatin/cPLA2 family phospholipase